METDTWKNPRAVIGLIGVLVLGSIVTVALLRERIVSGPFEQVTVQGEGRATYRPDTATVNLGVQVDRARTAEDALTQLNTNMSKIIAGIKAVGIPVEDITTGNYSLYPQYDYRDNITTVGGYNANQQLIIKIRNIKDSNEKVNQVISAASKSGVNQINGVTFDVSNSNDVRQEARLAAIADARAKAKDLAQSAGVKLGKVVGWTENYYGGPTPPVLYDKAVGMGGGGAPEVPAGSEEVVVTIGLIYRVK